MRYRIYNRFGTPRIAENGTNGRTNKLHKLRTIHLFAGAGGGILGDILLGHHPVCAVETDPYCQQVLHQRQKDGAIPWFPIFADVRHFDGRPWRGLVEVVCGGFPCQDISTAGKGAGITGARSGLWREMARIIGEVGPRFVFVENSPALTSRGLGTVLGDLAELGFDAEWGVLGAVHAGAPHRRNRIWIVGRHPERELAHADLRRCLHGQTEIVTAEAELNAQREPVSIGSDVADTMRLGQPGPWQLEQPSNSTPHRVREANRFDDGGEGNLRWWQSEPDVG